MTGTAVRPRLREDCRYVAVDGGVYLHTPTAAVRLQGGDLHRLLDRLAPHLDGATDVATLVTGLPPAQARVVRQLVEALLAHGMARDAAAEKPHGLAGWELRRYAAEIALAAHLSDSAAHRFERFRLGSVLLAGAGGLMPALARTMLLLGMRHLTVATTAEVRTDTSWYVDSLARCRESDPTQDLSMVDGHDLDGDPERVAARLAGFDAVLHCSDRPMLARAARVARAGRIAGVPVLHALPLRGAAWVGPSTGGTRDGCAECALRWLRATVLADDPAWSQMSLVDHPGAEPETYLSGPVTGLVAATLALAYFRLAVGAEASAGNRMIRVDLEAALTDEHPLSRHPRCQACGAAPRPPVAVRVADLSARASGTDEELSRWAAGLVDRRLGVVREVTERDLAQLPVNAVEVTVADLTDTGAGPVSVTAVAPDRVRARRRAVVRAVELATERAGPRAAGIEYWDPVGRTAAVMPTVARPRTVAAGFSWAEAVGRALLRLHARSPILPSGAGAAGGPGAGWRVVDLTDVDAECRGLVELADALGLRLRARLRTGTVAEARVDDGGRLSARGYALDGPTAVRTAVGLAVATAGGHPVALVEVAPDLGDPAWSDRLEPLLRRLAGRHRRVWVAPAAVGPAIATAVPFLASVLVDPNPAGSR